MADNDQSKIRYDDFISNVQPDPAKPESTIMLSGFVGRGQEGHARVYPDPTLGTWYDIPEGDVIYSRPIADSKLGGSYVWVRASSEIKPGSAAAPATEAAEPQQAAAVGMNPTPRTHCFVCDPPKAAAGVALQPTPATHCYICPPHTLPCSLLCQADPRGGAAPAAMGLPHTAATVCTQFGCPPQGPVGGQVGTFSIWCSLLCGTTKACAEAAAPAAMALPHTAATVCTQFGCVPNAMPPTLWCTWVGCPPHGAPQPQAAAHAAPGGLLQTHFLCTQGLATFCGCTPGIDCNAAPGNVQTQAPICTQGFPTFCGCTPGIDCGGLAAGAAPRQANTGVTVCVTDCQPPGNEMMKAAVGINPTPASHCFVCDPPKAAAAMQPTPTVQTHCFICPPHTQAVHCWTAPVVCDIMQMPTPATRCFICPPVNQTFATVCTQIGCPTHQIHCPTQPVVCNLQPTQPVVCGVLPPSFGCTQGCQQGGAQQQPAAMMAAPAHPNTAATLCTQQPACPPHTVHNSMCICPTPSAVHQCGGQTVFTPTIPQFTVVGMCPTFGVCPSMACTPFTPVQNGVFTPFGR
jgi:hypothetical protein